MGLTVFLFLSQWTEEDEIADYKKNQEWMDECMDGMFEKWYDKIDEEDSMEDRRKVIISRQDNFQPPLPQSLHIYTPGDMKINQPTLTTYMFTDAHVHCTLL